MRKAILALLAPAAIVAGATAAQAQVNQPPPANPVFSLTGQPQSTTFTRYSFSFSAANPSTNLTFAFRNDPVFIRFDDVSLSTGGGANLLVNGGFEDGPDGAAAPTGWTYLNQYGALAGGRVLSAGARTGNFGYYDGAVQAYDAITQSVLTSVGTTYDVSFWVAVNSVRGTGFYQPLSTNGINTGTGGNGIDLFAYVGVGAPVSGAVPEPSSWALMIMGFGLAGYAMRRRTAVVRYA
jgi:PEP-CTERM motif